MNTVPVSPRLYLLAAVLASTAWNLHAQGSIIPQTEAGSRRPDGGDSRGRAQTPDYRQYEYGKEIYAVKLGCKTCPLGDVALDESTARRFLSDESLWSVLNEKEYDAVTAFLRQRFTLLY